MSLNEYDGKVELEKLQGLKGIQTTFVNECHYLKDKLPLDTIPYLSSINKHTEYEDFSHKVIIFKEKFILMPT